MGKKNSYVKPVSFDVGKVDEVFGDCISGTSAAGTICDGGFDVSLEPTCQESGLNATNNCKIGDGAGNGCQTGISAAWGCFGGNTP